MLEYVLSRGSLDEVEASKWTNKLCSAISHLHANNLVHLDVKLENIFVDNSNELKLGDLGLSAFSSPGFKISKTCGSGVYAAPEVLTCQQIGAYDGRAADVWSVGICSFVMVRGRFPFNVDVPLRVLGAHATALKIANETGMPKPLRPPLVLNGAQQRSAFSANHLQLLDACLCLSPAARPSIDATAKMPWLARPHLQCFDSPASVTVALKAEVVKQREAVVPVQMPMTVDVGAAVEVGVVTPDNSPSCRPENGSPESKQRFCRPSPLSRSVPEKRTGAMVPLPAVTHHRFKRSGKRWAHCAPASQSA